jgi:magnesium chelatase subunit ChlI-like protein
MTGLTSVPTMTLAEVHATTRFRNIADLTGDRAALVTTRPCRAPRNTISDVGLISGGQVPTLGDVSRAHHACVAWMNSPNAAAMTSRSCVSRSRSVSYTYNFAGVVGLQTFTEFAIRMMAVRQVGQSR